ncbi:MAG: hypothetical protein Q4B26_00425 [Eubacteriales bacterium]|nr:hypothetical protein [Eubacteriales bacterium]
MQKNKEGRELLPSSEINSMIPKISKPDGAGDGKLMKSPPMIRRGRDKKYTLVTFSYYAEKGSDILIEGNIVKMHPPFAWTEYDLDTGEIVDEHYKAGKDIYGRDGSKWVVAFTMPEKTETEDDRPKTISIDYSHLDEARRQLLSNPESDSYLSDYRIYWDEIKKAVMPGFHWYMSLLSNVIKEEPRQEDEKKSGEKNTKEKKTEERDFSPGKNTEQVSANKKKKHKPKDRRTQENDEAAVANKKDTDSAQEKKAVEKNERRKNRDEVRVDEQQQQKKKNDAAIFSPGKNQTNLEQENTIREKEKKDVSKAAAVEKEQEEKTTLAKETEAVPSEEENKKISGTFLKSLPLVSKKKREKVVKNETEPLKEKEPSSVTGKPTTEAESETEQIEFKNSYGPADLHWTPKKNLSEIPESYFNILCRIAKKIRFLQCDEPKLRYEFPAFCHKTEKQDLVGAKMLMQVLILNNDSIRDEDRIEIKHFRKQTGSESILTRCEHAEDCLYHECPYVIAAYIKYLMATDKQQIIEQRKEYHENKRKVDLDRSLSYQMILPGSRLTSDELDELTLYIEKGLFEVTESETKDQYIVSMISDKNGNPVAVEPDTEPEIYAVSAYRVLRIDLENGLAESGKIHTIAGKVVPEYVSKLILVDYLIRSGRYDEYAKSIVESAGRDDQVLVYISSNRSVMTRTPVI